MRTPSTRTRDSDLTGGDVIGAGHHHGESSGARGGLLSNPDLLSAGGSGVLLALGFALHHAGAAEPLVTGVYLASALVAGWHAVLASLQQLLRFTFDVDLLMVVAAIGAGAVGRIEEGAMLLFLFALGHGLEGFATERARRAIDALGHLTPDVAWRLAAWPEAQEPERVPIASLRVGDVVRVLGGERLPVDGVVVLGDSTIDQSPITGESVPVAKSEGSAVFAGTLNGDGVLVVRTTKLPGESTMARMVKLVEESQANKGRVQRAAERFTRIYTPIILVTVPVLIGALLSTGMTFADAFTRAMAVLVGASPCALAISTPSAVLAGIARAARAGVLVKGGAAMEALGIVDAVAFDKTGTLTAGKPRVVAVLRAPGRSESDVLRFAASIDAQSTHPMARAVRELAEERGAGLALSPATDVRVHRGIGVSGIVDGERCALISPRAAISGSEWPTPGEALRAAIVAAEAQAQTVSVVVRGHEAIGAMVMADEPRAAASATLVKLRALGIRRTIMLTGDNSEVARVIAGTVGVDDIRADLLPEHKIDAVRGLLREFRGVAMVGDGVNDAPALAAATVGIAMGSSGTDVALEAADVALMSDDLSRLPFAFALSRRTRTIIRQNVAISLGVVALLIVGASVGWVGLGLAVVLHEGSTVVVAFNALRLLAVRESTTG